LRLTSASARRARAHLAGKDRRRSEGLQQRDKRVGIQRPREIVALKLRAAELRHHDGFELSLDTLKGYARLMIRALVDLAAAKGLRGLVARHPWVPISDYIAGTDQDGRIYDPWLRSHLSAGGKLIGPCERSMVVHEPIAFWENWSKQRFRESGDYALEGALAPVRIDLERQMGPLRRAECLGILRVLIGAPRSLRYAAALHPANSFRSG
jgi:hypothetical protein